MASINYKDPSTGQLLPIVGPPGKSAYDSAVEGGYTGTKEEFYKLLATIGNVSNPNLLINGNLINPINQRGRSIYSGYVYGIDRWLGGTNALVELKSSNELKVSYSGTISMTLQRQNIENYQALAGQTLTLTVKVKNVTGKIAIYISDGNKIYRTSEITTDGIYSVTGEISSVPTQLYIGISADSPCSFYPVYAKLELGDHFTGFYPTDPATELAKCQRYLFAPWRTDGIQGYTGYVQSNGGDMCYGMIYTPVTLRAVPSIALGPTNLRYWGTVNGSFTNNAIVTAARACGYTNNGVQMEFALDKTLAAGDSGLIYANTPGPETLLLDCEIY